jgi:CRP-like cAMP-binding protein
MGILRRIGFAGCTKRELTAANRFMTSLLVSSGQRLTNEGVSAQQCMIIESGTVSVRRNGGEIDVLGAGDWIDGDALLLDRVSAATTVALTDLTISVMTLQEFASVLAVVPSVARAMQRRQVTHLGSAVRPKSSRDADTYPTVGGVVAVASGS